jgi:KipI family sensor histidine kinase inhibitor
VLDIIPAYASIALVFAPGSDPTATRAAVGAWLARTLEAWASGTPAGAGQVSPGPVDLVVHYDGPDLDELAAHAGMSAQEVVRRHVAPTYTVAMLGFAPGFPYLLGMDPALAMPRRDSPRSEVPAGSVGIADAQTGIYPHASPGGWRLIGRTAARLFTPEGSAPTLLRPGDRVRLRAA